MVALPGAHIASRYRWGLSVGRDLRAEVIVVRNESGTVKAFFNVCRHRALRLCEQPAGHVKAALRCPYHGWSYDLDGRLVAAPNMAGTEGFDQSEFPLAPINIEISNGLIFGSLQPRQTLNELLSPLGPLVENWSIESLVVATVLNYEVAANWKLLVQNFSECYHCPIVHPQLNRLTAFRSAENQLDNGGPVAGGPMLLEPNAETMSLNGRMAGSPIPTLTDEQKRRVYYYSIFPTMFLSPHPDYVMVHRLVPRSVDKTQVVCQLLTQAETRCHRGFRPSRPVLGPDEPARLGDV